MFRVTQVTRGSLETIHINGTRKVRIECGARIAFVSAKEYRFFLESHISGNTRIGKCQQNRTSQFFLDLYFSFIFLRKFIHP